MIFMGVQEEFPQKKIPVPNFPEKKNRDREKSFVDIVLYANKRQDHVTDKKIQAQKLLPAPP